MSFELFSYFMVKSAGIGAGVFFGLLIGLGMRAKGGSREGLIRDSVGGTAAVAGVAALFFTAFVRMITYSG